jgi:hypothetical protein
MRMMMILVIVHLQVHHAMCAQVRIQNVRLLSLTVGLSLSTLLRVRELSLWLSLPPIALGQHQSEFSTSGDFLEEAGKFSAHQYKFYNKIT